MLTQFSSSGEQMKDGRGIMLHLECFLVLWPEFPGDKGQASALPVLSQGWLCCGTGDIGDISCGCFSSVLQLPSPSVVTVYSNCRVLLNYT